MLKLDNKLKKLKMSSSGASSSASGKSSGGSNSSGSGSSAQSVDSRHSYAEDKENPVLVTGGNGYLGSHIVSELLNQGYSVRCSVKDSSSPRDHIEKMQHTYPGKLEIVEAKLEDFVTKWKEVVRGCIGIIHTAAPNPYRPTKTHLEVVYPCVEGIVNVLKAAEEEGVKKLVYAGCYCSIRGSVHKENYLEDDWGEPSLMTGIERAKLVTERTLWSFQNADFPVALTVINLGLLLGPSIQKKLNYSSGLFMKQLCEGKSGSLIKIHLPTVDVRTAAQAMIEGLFMREADGKRYICVENSHWLHSIPLEVSSAYESTLVKDLNLKETSIWSLRLTALFDKNIKSMMPFINKETYYSKEAIEDDLNIDFLPFQQTVLDMVKRMLELEQIEGLHTKEKTGTSSARKTRKTIGGKQRLSKVIAPEVAPPSGGYKKEGLFATMKNLFTSLRKE